MGLVSFLPIGDEGGTAQVTGKFRGLLGAGAVGEQQAVEQATQNLSFFLTNRFLGLLGGLLVFDPFAVSRRSLDPG
jgi:asparagine N-glycosylation enzyme membrane subunit Stt3